MPIPRLLHPTQCTIQRIDKASTVYDPEAREPVQAASRRASVTLPGQVKWVSEREMQSHFAGVESAARGYIVFRQVDLTAAGFTLQLNDRIAAQGHLVDEVYIVKIEPFAHYADQNGATLFKAWFADRKPAKER